MPGHLCFDRTSLVTTQALHRITCEDASRVEETGT
jgi:hypothetical protein